MDPNDHPPESPSADDATNVDGNGVNGLGAACEFTRVPVPPEIIEWMLQQDDDEQAARDLKEVLENGGYKLADFLPELKRLAGINE